MNELQAFNKMCNWIERHPFTFGILFAFTAGFIGILLARVLVLSMPRLLSSSASSALKWPDVDCSWLGDHPADNWHEYKVVMAGPNRCRMVVDREAEQRTAARDTDRQILWTALQTRRLSSAELKEVAGYGDRLNIETNVPYNPDEKARELQAALAIQAVWQSRKN